MKVKASIIIPAYNAQAYLAETLESCLRQTQDKIEIIVVNDASTDGTLALANFYAAKDPRVKVITYEENRGRSEARNTGCRAAESDVLLMMDSDDIMAPGRVADTLAAFKKAPRIGIVYGKFQVIDALGNLQGIVDANPFDWERLKKEGFAFICHSTMAFRKSVFKKVQYTSGDYAKHGIDDWRFQVDAYKAGVKFAPIRKVLAQYRFAPKERDEKRILELKQEAIG